MNKLIFYLLILTLPLFTLSSENKTEKTAQVSKEIETVIQMEKLDRPLTPLEEAVISNDYQKVKLLLEKQKANPNPPNTNQGFPLIYAVFHDNLEMVELLLTHKANINAKMKTGITPLYLAVARNQISMTDLLVSKGADVNQTIYGTSLHDMAMAHGYAEIAGVLKRAGAKVRPLFQEKAPSQAPTKSKQ